MKPNILLRLVDGTPLAIDYNLNALISDVLWLGVSYRPPESVSGIVQLHISQRFMVGYSYDHVIQERLQEISNSSHEIMINYRIPLFKDRVVTPRYF